MNKHLLFPNRFRLVGWLLFVPSALLGLAHMYADYAISSFTIDSSLGWKTDNGGANTVPLFLGNNNLTDELAAVGTLVGLILIAFSKEQVEDEMISRLRLEALQWSVYANYLVLLVAIITVYDMAFFNVMVYNMFTMLLVFVGRFRWLIYRNDNLTAA